MQRLRGSRQCLGPHKWVTSVASERTDRKVLPQLPSCLNTIDDVPSNISVCLDALSVFTVKYVEQTAKALKAHESDDDKRCIKIEQLSVDEDGKVSGDSSESNSGTVTGSSARSSPADDSQKSDPNAVYMLVSPLQRKFEGALSMLMANTYAIVTKCHRYEMTVFGVPPQADSS